VSGAADSIGSLHLAPPAACSKHDLAEFAELVRQGFPGAVNLDARILEADLLGLYRVADGRLVAVAALKRPDEQHRCALFVGAGFAVHAAEYELDLGWIFVDPALRRCGIASHLCSRLLSQVPNTGVFATTRPSNGAMLSILRAHDFTQIGTPFLHPHRKEHLVLFVRPRTPTTADRRAAVL
jgi:GNAT superfamily N-acetyltransferase